jgi:hypothetical protein
MLIQQVTKAGVMVGKNVLKHITDGHLSLEIRKPKEGEVINFDESSGIIKGENGWIIERLAP